MLETPPPGQSPIIMCPLRQAVIRLGVARLDAEFQPQGEDHDRHAIFVPFPDSFANDQFANVRLLITNRNHPQVVGTATTGLHDGVQGFLLTARNTVGTGDILGDESATVQGVEFAWMAILPTDTTQQQRHNVRFGLVPFREYREFQNRLSFTFPDTDTLYADAPLQSTAEKFVFLTTTVSGAANAAAGEASETGIPQIVAHQTGHRNGGARLHWLVVSRSLDENPQSTAPAEAARSPASQYFDSDALWLHVARGKPTRIKSRAWEHRWMKFLVPWQERSPCVFATANRHGISGHHSGAVVMSWHCRRDSYVVKYRSFDALAGESNFDALAIGHCDSTPDDVAAAHREGIPAISAWERFLEADFGACKYVSNAQIGANEFGDHGGSLLFHLIYDDAMDELRELLALGADANQKQPGTFARPLHIAAMFGKRDIAQVLIEHGADTNAKTSPNTESNYPPRWKLTNQHRPYQGETPLHLAIYYRRFDVAGLLLNAGADPNAEDANHDRPIDYLPAWHTFPDNRLHWKLINERRLATKADYQHIFDWIASEEERDKKQLLK